MGCGASTELQARDPSAHSIYRRNEYQDDEEYSSLRIANPWERPVARAEAFGILHKIIASGIGMADSVAGYSAEELGRKKKNDVPGVSSFKIVLFEPRFLCCCCVETKFN